MAAPPVLGIVAGVCNPGPSIRSFVRYHLAVGFHRVYLVFDDINDRWMGHVPRDPRVTVIDSRELEPVRPLADAGGEAESEAAYRHKRDAGAALRMAREDGLDWLLHLDTDEAFYLFGDSLASHFAELMDDGVENVKYLNYEAIPEKPDIEDYFLEVSLFKRNPLELHEEGHESALKLFAERIPQIPDRFFLSYVHGKSAVRVLPGVRSLGRHGFASDTGLKSELLTRPAVLHYMNAGVPNFLRYYNGQKRAPLWSDKNGSAPPEVDLDDPDAAATIYRFYERNVVLRDEEWKKQLCDAGLCVRLENAVQGVLSATAD